MTPLRTLLTKYNPAVKKEYLLLPAGFMWMGVGVMLSLLAIVWLVPVRNHLLLEVSGLISGLIIYRFGFVKLARRNVSRIEALPGKRCFFSFMTLKSYLLVIFMMTLGITLRHSSIPKEWLSVLYNGIGIGLGLSSLTYFNAFLKMRGNRPSLLKS